MSKITTILFDLGGVLLELDGPPIKADWANKPLTHEQNWLAWMNSPVVKQFETGKLSADEFVTQVIPDLGLQVTETVFRQAFIEWPKALFEGAPEILQVLKPNYTLAFFSNTNELHLPRLLKELALAEYFHHTFASYDIGYFKPDESGFAFVCDAMQVSPSEVLFIDDNQINVDGARRAGLRAEQAHGIDAVSAVLRKSGCLE